MNFGTILGFFSGLRPATTTSGASKSRHLPPINIIWMHKCGFWRVLITHAFITLWWIVYYIKELGNRVHECHRLGDQDLYGVGIRIAVYTQLSLTAFLDFYHPRLASNLAPINIWYMTALTIVSFVLLRNTEENIWDIQIVLALTSCYATILQVGIHDGSEAFENQFTTFWRSAIVMMGGSVMVFYGCVHLPKVLTNIADDCSLLWQTFSAFSSLLASMSTTLLIYQMESLIFLIISFVSTLLHLICGVIICYLIIFHTTSVKGFYREALPSKMLCCLDYLLDVPNTDVQLIVFGARVGVNTSMLSPFKRDAINAMKYRLHCHLIDHYTISENDLNYTLADSLEWKEIQQMHMRESEVELIRDRMYSVIAFSTVLNMAITVEFTLILDRVEGVNNIGATGQMLAFVVALGSFLTVWPIYYRLTKTRTRKQVVKPEYDNVCPSTIVALPSRRAT
ncbi:hypothetical protein BDZ91DRAFT_801565 [Kalaharituber pfeilii]|nr:hypothetical protein BDZ91DRAFT_801565 [Kalaharituber pfeilii]